MGWHTEASLTFALPCFSRGQNKGISGSKSDNVLIYWGEKENKKEEEVIGELFVRSFLVFLLSPRINL